MFMIGSGNVIIPYESRFTLLSLLQEVIKPLYQGFINEGHHSAPGGGGGGSYYDDDDDDGAV